VSTTLADFLHQKAVQHRAEAEMNKDTVEEWRSAIDKLFKNIQQWITESDPDNLIEISIGRQEIKEPGIGLYEVPRLNLRILGKWIGIIPKARKTVDAAKPTQLGAPSHAAGRVDITDELIRYVLYRFQKEGQDEWMIDRAPPERDWPGQILYVPKMELQPLDKSTFEKALMSYLQ
jgi:hypothetical protein